MYFKVWCHNFFSHSLQPLKMNMKIENLTTDEVQLVIWFLKSKNACLVLIHRQIVEVCGEGAKNKRNVRKWCRLFKKGTHHRRYMRIIEQFSWAIFEHLPPYSPIFKSDNYRLFLHLTRKFGQPVRGMTKRQKTGWKVWQWPLSMKANRSWSHDMKSAWNYMVTMWRSS